MPEKSNENLASQILNPKDLIAYQEGSVVSRMIVYKKSGTITSLPSIQVKACRSIPHHSMLLPQLSMPKQRSQLRRPSFSSGKAR
jgi:hypothetical protein